MVLSAQCGLCGIFSSLKDKVDNIVWKVCHVISVTFVVQSVLGMCGL